MIDGATTWKSSIRTLFPAAFIVRGAVPGGAVGGVVRSVSPVLVHRQFAPSVLQSSLPKIDTFVRTETASSKEPTHT
ncbi:hypothetical protein BE04_16895 [Sorangium cellulosum]|uniref:Uncharacterized protein n=1 Tax=Sorangium cellulosum TaxID=56 RepID=A0A150P1A9_SORCE|nr:hypothetical protein BE04_16895 [Sorangium cellulosum]